MGAKHGLVFIPSRDALDVVYSGDSEPYAGNG